MYRLNQIIRNLISLAVIIFSLGIMCYIFGGYVDYNNPFFIARKYTISLKVIDLLFYSFMSISRIMISICISWILSIFLGRMMAYNVAIAKYAILIIDICQSIPAAGFFTLTSATFVALTPHSLFGAQLAVIFVLITAQIWNMIISVYQQLIQMPASYRTLIQVCKLSASTVFWKIELPLIIPSLIWNTMLSISASWFMIVASECLVVNTSYGKINFNLPGIGGFISKSNEQGYYLGILLATIAILASIFIIENLIFQPIFFRFCKYKRPNKPFFLSIIEYLYLDKIFFLIWYANYSIYFLVSTYIRHSFIFIKRNIFRFFESVLKHWQLILLNTIFCLIGIGAAIFLKHSTKSALYSFNGVYVTRLLLMGICTTIRVAITLLLCTIIAVPIGTYIGNRKKLLFYFKPIIQLFSSFPVNIFYGIFANVAISCRLNFDFICISIMVLGSIWYVLFNVLSGIESIPEDYWKIVQVLKLSGISLWYKFIIPAILPSYVSGIITASGAAWNASILCEYISWKTNTFRSFGIGEYIARNNGNFFEVSLGILIISTIILILNKLIWKPLLQYVAVRFNFIRAEEN